MFCRKQFRNWRTCFLSTSLVLGLCISRENTHHGFGLLSILWLLTWSPKSSSSGTRHHSIVPAIPTVQNTWIFRALQKEREPDVSETYWDMKRSKGDARDEGTVRGTVDDCSAAGWPQRTRVGETGQRPNCLWFCRLNTMFNYVLLCGSEGLQNHLI